MNKNRYEYFYREISNILKDYDNELFENFSILIGEGDPKKIYMWLEEVVKARRISPELNDIMTDFFFSIH